MEMPLPACDRLQTDLPPTRAEGLRRIAAFAPRMGRVYAARRNFDLGPGDRGNVSLLSPFLSHRLVTETEVIGAALARHSPGQAEKFIQEVCWRSYWKGWLERRPGVWDAWRAEVAAPPEPELAARIARAEAGQTGIDAFDAWARELAQTGWLHNHARMWAASIWIFTLGLPWARGAEWFLHHLVDADAASNTLSWRWVAGLHTPGKHYLARPDNIATYTEGRLAAQGLCHAPPPPAPPLPPPGPIRQAPPPDWEQPTALVLTPEDLCLEQAMPVDRAVAVAILDLGQRRTPRGRGDAALAFDLGALADAAARAGVPDAPRLAPTDLASWARDHGARRIATGFAQVGWTRDGWTEAAPGLAAAGIGLDEWRRPWDAALQPHATAGFFRLKNFIPELLTRHFGAT